MLLQREQTSTQRWEHIETTMLMRHIENGPRGTRMLIAGEYKPRLKQLSEQAIRIVEKVLIEHALTEDYELLNKVGTKTPTHAVRFSGFSPTTSLSCADQICPRIPTTVTV